MNAVERLPSLALQFGTWGRNGKLRHSTRVIAVDDVFDASRKWEAIRDRYDFVSNQSLIVSIVDTATGNAVAKISYNGRIWGTDGKEICAS